MEHKGKAAGYLQFGTLQVNTIVYPFRARKRPYTSDYEVLAKPIECRVAEFIGFCLPRELAPFTSSNITNNTISSVTNSSMCLNVYHASVTCLITGNI